jgi:release factor glutamine methyltransferase
MNEKERYILLKQELQTIYDEREASSIASMVMEHITGQNRTDRLMTNHPLDEATLNEIAMIEQRLLQQEPVQYIIGDAFFIR